SAEVDYCRGMALARLQRWDEAKQAFERGRRKNPRDKRFPIELAGVAFKQGREGDAKSCLHAALKLDPSDEYAANFLATLYLLDGNLEAALQSWNKAGKPTIREIKVEPPLRTSPELIDRSIAAAPASVLRLEDFRTTRARLKALGVFSAFRLDLNPSSAPDSGDYDLQLSASERNGWGNSRTEGLLSLAAGVPYQTVYPEFYNLKHSAINVRSLVRWDSKKRRAWLSISAPLGERPAWHYRFFADVRDEDWDVTNTFHGPAGFPREFTVRKAEAGGEVQGILNSRLTWTGGVAASTRAFRSAAPNGFIASPEFTDTFVLEVHSRADIALVRVPERRFTLDSSWTARLGNATAAGLGKYGAAQGVLESRWFPKARGDDYEMLGSFRGGRIFGPAPLDELYILGLERDNDLPLRAHIGTAHGRKGSAPLGRGYWLSNWEINKNLITVGWIRLRVAPFLDSGRAYDSSFGSRQWLWDTGGELKIIAPGGMTLVLTYGKDLRTGRNSFYAAVERRAR
ncbi:MAG: tetratricopeptide repeat protein, partial [Deltaproteobacteria bacterium]